MHWYWQTFPHLQMSTSSQPSLMCFSTQLSFVDSLSQIFCPILSNSPILALDTRQDKRMIHTFLLRYQCSVFTAVPSLLQMFCDLIWDRHHDTKPSVSILPALRLLMVSGEPLTLSLARRLSKLFPTTTLMNVYGSTEVAADCSAFIWKRPHESELQFCLDTSDSEDTSHVLPIPTKSTSVIQVPSGYVPIGKPIAGFELLLLPNEFNSSSQWMHNLMELPNVQEGIQGELCVIIFFKKSNSISSIKLYYFLLSFIYLLINYSGGRFRSSFGLPQSRITKCSTIWIHLFKCVK